MLKYEIVRNTRNEYLCYCRYGKFHRIDHPAFIWDDGEMNWYQYGEYHRINSPAVIRSNGLSDHFIRGKYVKISNSAK